MRIDTDPIIEKISKVCDDTSHSPQESLEAWEDIEAHARTAAIALREEIGEDE